MIERRYDAGRSNPREVCITVVNPDSLAATLDVVNEAFFFERPLSKSDREETAKWIACRQGEPGSYANMFAPTESDYREGVRLFTGERIRSGAATGHILGEEACRALILLDVSSADVRNALDRAGFGMMERLKRSEASGTTLGTYCCGTCTCSLWRHLAVGGLESGERRLVAGMKALKAHREGNGRWRRFPFYYTLLALSEIELPSAVEEMRYASTVCERYLRRRPEQNKIGERRRLLAERVLEMC